MHRAVIATLLLLAWASQARADVRIYLIHRETITRANRPTLAIKYLEADTDKSPRWTPVERSPSTPFVVSNNGSEAWALVSADLTDAGQTAIAKASDVVIFPADLSTRLNPGNVKTLTAILGGMTLPTRWITPALTWADIESGLAGLFAFNQRLRGALDGEKLTDQAALTTAVKDLPARKQAALTEAADYLKVTKGKMGQNDTVADAYEDIVAQARAKGARVK